MSPVPDIKIPESEAELLGWAAANPGELRAALLRSNLFTNLLISFTQAVGAKQAPWNLIGTGEQLILPIPIIFPNTVDDVATYSATAGGAYSQADLQALMNQVTAVTNKINELTGQLRSVNINPSSSTSA